MLQDTELFFRGIEPMPLMLRSKINLFVLFALYTKKIGKINSRKNNTCFFTLLMQNAYFLIVFVLVSNYINYEIDPQLDLQNLRICKPCVVEKIVGDWNCYFRSFSFILNCCQENQYNLRTIIVTNMLGR